MGQSLDAQIHQFLSGLAKENVVETHAARIYLLEEEALKIKRSVKYDYLDFRSLDDRRRALDRELELNEPTAPSIYRDVVALTREPDGDLAIDGAGEPVEWVLRMKRFPAEDELPAVAARGGLDRPLSEALGRTVYDLHITCTRKAEDGGQLIEEILDEFAREFGNLRERGAELEAIPVISRLRAELEAARPLLRQRTADGYVRRCHGDLHLHNIVLLDGVPTLFDALEFDERLGTCDVLYDLAFLLMDLVAKDFVQPANVVLNAYCEREASASALRGLGALPLFTGVRAMVRAMVGADIQVNQSQGTPDYSDAKSYVSLAGELLRKRTPQLVAIGGLSGTGKTTIAREVASDVAWPFGALHIRSDVERKRLAGMDPLQHLPAAAYTAEASRATYAAMRERAKVCLAAGQSVIFDAVFAEEDERRAMEALAAEVNVPLSTLWLTAPVTARLDRVGMRDRDASDADTTVVRAQSQAETGEITWVKLSTEGDLEETLKRVRTALAIDTTC